MPLSVTCPSTVHVERTPTSTAAIADHVMRRSRRVPEPRTLAFSAVRADAGNGSPRGRTRSLAVPGLVVAAVFVVVYRRVLGVKQLPSWPPPADAVSPEGAQAATEAFAAW